MTMAAAAGTLVVVIGVIAGPSLYQCASSPEGLLSCLRQDVVEAGLLPPAEQNPEPPVEADNLPPSTTKPQPAAPSVELIRAEPDGNVIIAGSAGPGIEVEVFANGDLVGKVIAEASGDWVLVPDRPLAVGSAEISVGIAGSNERSPHTFTVTIPEDRTSQPVITVLEAGPSAEPPIPEATSGPSPTTPSNADAEVAAVEPWALPDAQFNVLPTPYAPDFQPQPLPAPPADATSPPPQVARTEPEPVPEVAPPVESAEGELSVPASVPPAAPVPQPGREPPTQVAVAEPMPEPSAPPVTPVPPHPATIDAIEIDGAANYFAGAGPEGATVQLYVQDRFIASAKVEGGRWLVEAQGVLTLPVQRVRIDLIEPQQGDVSVRAEVNFVIDVPLPIPEIEAAAAATGQVTPAATASGELAIAPQVESELEVDPAIPTLRALPSVEPGMLRFASGKAIIRRGETLWAIAERVYGDGSRYRLIVDANPELISRPGQIFPGQVFDLPKDED